MSNGNANNNVFPDVKITKSLRKFNSMKFEIKSRNRQREIEYTSVVLKNQRPSRAMKRAMTLPLDSYH